MRISEKDESNWLEQLKGKLFRCLATGIKRQIKNKTQFIITITVCTFQLFYYQIRDLVLSYIVRIIYRNSLQEIIPTGPYK